MELRHSTSIRREVGSGLAAEQPVQRRRLDMLNDHDFFLLRKKKVILFFLHGIFFLSREYVMEES